MSPLAKRVLLTHEVETFVLGAVGLTEDERGATKADKAYSELQSLGLVEEGARRVTVYEGSVPRKLFQLTEKGKAERYRLLAEGVSENSE